MIWRGGKLLHSSLNVIEFPSPPLAMTILHVRYLHREYRVRNDQTIDAGINRKFHSAGTLLLRHRGMVRTFQAGIL